MFWLDCGYLGEFLAISGLHPRNVLGVPILAPARHVPSDCSIWTPGIGGELSHKHDVVGLPVPDRREQMEGKAISVNSDVKRFTWCWTNWDFIISLHTPFVQESTFNVCGLKECN